MLADLSYLVQPKPYHVKILSIPGGRNFNNKVEYICQTCGKILSCRAALSRHVKVVHLRQKNWQCRYCDKLFGQNSDRVIHEKRNHLPPSRHEGSQRDENLMLAAVSI